MTDIDVAAFATRLGLQVFVSDLDADVRVAVFRKPDGVTELHVNNADPMGTVRFATAHAIALYWRGVDRDDFGHIVRSEHLAATVGPSGEANRFAWALLGDVGAV